MPDNQQTAEFRDLLEEERSELLSKLAELGGSEGSELTYDSNFADSSQVTAERSEAEVLVASFVKRSKTSKGHSGNSKKAPTVAARTAGTRSIRSASKPCPGAQLHRLRFETLSVGAPWPSGPQGGPRRRMDPRWLTLIVIGVIVVIVLVRQHKIHVSEPTVLYFLAIVPSIILHEVTHGWVALGFGDDTAKKRGPALIEPACPRVAVRDTHPPCTARAFGLSAVRMGEAGAREHVAMRHPRNDDVVVVLAGPAMNIALAVALGVAFRLAVPAIDKASIYFYGLQSGVGQPVWAQYLFAFGYVNVILAVFNLIPIPPLDGASVLERLLPRQWLPGYLSIRQYTIFLPFLIIWIHPQWIDDIFQPFLNYWAHILGPVTVSQF